MQDYSGVCPLPQILYFSFWISKSIWHFRTIIMVYKYCQWLVTCKITCSWFSTRKSINNFEVFIFLLFFMIFYMSAKQLFWFQLCFSKNTRRLHPPNQLRHQRPLLFPLKPVPQKAKVQLRKYESRDLFLILTIKQILMTLHVIKLQSITSMSICLIQ